MINDNKIFSITKVDNSLIETRLVPSQRTLLLNDFLKVSAKKKFQCPVEGCVKSFSRNSSLKVHQKNIHSNIEKYECNHPDCGRLFSEKGNLKVHLRIHTGERPYKCSECEKTFTFVGNWSDHQRRHDQKKPHECVFCDKQYYRKYLLKSHLDKKHQVLGINIDLRANKFGLIKQNRSKNGKQFLRKMEQALVQDSTPQFETEQINNLNPKYIYCGTSQTLLSLETSEKFSLNDKIKTEYFSMMNNKTLSGSLPLPENIYMLEQARSQDEIIYSDNVQHQNFNEFDKPDPEKSFNHYFMQIQNFSDLNQ